MNLVLARRAAVAALGLIIALIAIISWVMVAQAVVAEREPVEVTPTDYGMAYEDVTFSPRMPEERAEDDPIVLRGWWIPYKYATGWRTIRNHRRAWAGFKPRPRPRHLHAPHQVLRNEGFSLLLFDLRAHGESDGEVMSAGYYERFDVLGAMDVAEHRYGIPSERIGVLGFSMGGVASLLAATEEPRLRALVIDSAYADIDDLFAAEVAERTPLPAWTLSALQPGMEIVGRIRYGIRLSALKPERFVAELDFPILFTHSDDDDRISVDHSERIATAATHPLTRLRHLPLRRP